MKDWHAKYISLCLYKCQFGCGILKMVGPKMQDFCPRIDKLKGNRCILRIRVAPVCQKVPKSYFQSQFSMSNINLGDHFLWKTFFSNFNFWTTLFSKIMPNFWRTGAPRILKIQRFPLSMSFLGQKACILGPTIFKIPQPNWQGCRGCHDTLRFWQMS